MEKRKPSFDLDAFKAVVRESRGSAITLSASLSAAALGLGRNEIVAVIQSMERKQFQKSMTSYADHRRWQDVYHVPWGGMTLYVKFTDHVVTRFMILSFKER